jgi:hypothetical protein
MRGISNFAGTQLTSWNFLAWITSVSMNVANFTCLPRHHCQPQENKHLKNGLTSVHEQSFYTSDKHTPAPRHPVTFLNTSSSPRLRKLFSLRLPPSLSSRWRVRRCSRRRLRRRDTGHLYSPRIGDAVPIQTRISSLRL